MTLFRARRLNIRDFRIVLAAVGATSATIAASASLWGDTHVVRLVAMACGALLASLAYEPLLRVVRPPHFVVTLADWAFVAGMGAMLACASLSGLPLAQNALLWFAGGGVFMATLVVRDWLYFTVLRETA
jgi:ribose/xylose/arabinose/galactoside ABC-type transport system permease subunit